MPDGKYLVMQIIAQADKEPNAFLYGLFYQYPEEFEGYQGAKFQMKKYKLIREASQEEFFHPETIPEYKKQDIKKWD